MNALIKMNMSIGNMFEFFSLKKIIVRKKLGNGLSPDPEVYGRYIYI